MLTPHKQPDTNQPRFPLRNTCASGLALGGIFSLIYFLSPPFEYGSEAQRPILLVTALLVLAGAIATFGLLNALRVPSGQRKTLAMLMLCFAASIRLVALFTCPILEIDYYRYIWDGKVAATGVSPYLYSPEQVLSAQPQGRHSSDKQLGKLKTLSLESESNHTILSRIHFESHTTIYPPVSQFVFAMAMNWFPNSASVQAHVVAMKLTLFIFDFGIILLVQWMLRLLNRHAGWLIVYAWNPLVIKEISNGAHLDSIATFLFVLSVCLLLRWQRSGGQKSGNIFLASSAITLALSVGAKLFPFVMLPAFAVFIARRNWGQAGLFVAMFFAASVLVMMPMASPIANIAESESKPLNATESKHGAVGFFSHWRMNDTIFSCVYLNLKHSQRPIEKTPWYVFTKNEDRQKFESWLRAKIKANANAAFIAARVLTLSVFCAFFAWQLLRLFRRGIASKNEPTTESLCFLRTMALVLTVFLFLQPTVNPWYFVWVLPLLCFTSNRTWLAISSLILTYYSRFWFERQSFELSFGGRSYDGAGIYDHIVAWIVAVLAIVILALPRILVAGKRRPDDFDQIVDTGAKIG